MESQPPQKLGRKIDNNDEEAGPGDLTVLAGPGAGIAPIPSKYPQLPVAADDGSCV